MKKIFLLSFLFCFTYINNNAQSILSFGNILSINGDTVEVEIVLDNNSGLALGGFQFDLENGRIDTAYGGDIATFGWEHQVYYNPNFTATSSRILCFNLGSTSIPADSSVLMILRFITINTAEDICLTGIVISDQSGNSISTSSGPCISINNISFPEITFKSQIINFPNPTHGELLIDLGKLYTEIKVALISVSGQVLSSNVYYSTSTINYQIDEPVGFYLIELVNQYGEKASFKILKQ